MGEVLAHVRGEVALPCRIVDDPTAERIVALRRRMKLSRRRFADRFGLDARAVQDWEQGRRMPDRAARVLLTVIDRDPDAVVWALGGDLRQSGSGDAGTNAADAATTHRWAVLETERRRHLENGPRFRALAPPEAFSDQMAPAEALDRLCPGGDPALTGRRSEAVYWRIVRSCAGWGEKPTSEEFYDAVRAASPTDRQTAIVLMWATEATLPELLRAWAQRAYTLRQLVRALHLARFTGPGRVRQINQWVSTGTCSGPDAWNA